VKRGIPQGLKPSLGTYGRPHGFLCGPPTTRNQNLIVVRWHEFAPKIRRIHHMCADAVVWWAMRT